MATNTLPGAMRPANAPVRAEPPPTNDKGQFVLPEPPASTSPELMALFAEYRSRFLAGTEEDAAHWAAAAAASAVFEPHSIADLAAKLLLAIHFRDPEYDGAKLTIEAPEPKSDRLAVEMELICLDWLLATSERRTSNADAWAAAETALAHADGALDALSGDYSDEEVDRLADVREDAINDILDLAAVTSAQAIRKLELAMFDHQMVRNGANFPALLAEAKRLAEGEHHG